MTAASVPSELRGLRPQDLAAYKALRDAVLAAEPSAFTSDARSERRKPPESYLPRLGLDLPYGGTFTLGAWRGGELLGALSCEREPRAKAHHTAHVAGMMVRADARGLGLGRALLDECIARSRAAGGIELLTLSVTAGNTPALRLYERAGFVRYGALPRAIRVDGRYYAKELMALSL
jgi:ribosomal protein S18 acetylase RimI-like enzyme